MSTSIGEESLTEEEDLMIDLFYAEANQFAVSEVGFPPCPKGGNCGCPKVKSKLGLNDHNCDPNPNSGCVVCSHVFKKGLRM